MIGTLWRDFWNHPHKPIYVKILLAINLPGSLAGFLWYKNQLAATPMYYWLFVPDSPASSSLFTLVLILFLTVKKPPSLLQLLACLGVIKYGVWAMAVLISYWLMGGTMTALDVAMWLSHLGMAVEGWVFLRVLKTPQWEAIFSWIWMYLHDFMDYYLKLHPYLPKENLFIPIMLFTLLLTTILGIFVSAPWRNMTKYSSY